MSTDPNYCALCYSAAAKAGRPVKLTDVYKYAICSLCESRIRNGLTHYVPSSGTEGRMFTARCKRCRHCSEHPNGYPVCAFKIMDQLLESGWCDSDSSKGWWDPSVMKTREADGSHIFPAQCLKFTDRRDGDGETRDPPAPDVEGQMFFGDLLTVPERVPARSPQAAVSVSA